jgi:NAD(P)-dependent dehydrogenase (short-subunit alcohol dehydrogenase family)
MNLNMQKTILITGSTDGIGRETAFQLATKGYRVLIHGRNPEKVGRVVYDIKKQKSIDNVEAYVADFSSLKEVEKMADTLLANEGKLDVMLNNAGVIMKTFQLSVDGYEMTFAINHLAHFYLTGRLMPLLKSAGEAKIINLSSMVHSRSIDINTMLDRAYFDSINAYSNSKLCNILFTFKLSEVISDKSITVNCMHPGVINTKMLTETWGPVGSPVEEGAEREIFLVESSLTETISGKYFQDNRITEPAKISDNRNLQESLWDLSLLLLEKAGVETDSLYV